MLLALKWELHLNRIPQTPIAFASQFLNPTEERYSVNELELLEVVWSIDYFKNYLYGKDFIVITDRELLSILIDQIHPIIAAFLDVLTVYCPITS